MRTARQARARGKRTAALEFWELRNMAYDLVKNKYGRKRNGCIPRNLLYCSREKARREKSAQKGKTTFRIRTRFFFENNSCQALICLFLVTGWPHTLLPHF